MTDRPILFSAPMVRALLDGRKTQTRRVLKPWPGAQAKWLTMSVLHQSPSCQLADCHGHLGVQMQHPRAGQRINGIDIDSMSPLTWVRLPYAPGDRLWVRETWRPHYLGDGIWDLDLTYAADDERRTIKDGEFGEKDWTWPKAADRGNVSPLFMPRWASRLTLAVTDVRVQRLQDISEVDAQAEGIERMKTGRGYYDPTVSKAMVRAGVWHRKASQAFEALWESLNANRAPWGSNPWVVALSFTVQRGNIDQVGLTDRQLRDQITGGGA